MRPHPTGGRSREDGESRTGQPRAASAATQGGLARWVMEELARVTPRGRVGPATAEVEQAALAFVAGRYGKAQHHAEQAKELSPRFAPTREILGLAAYRLGRWEQALTELRTYRRLAGDTTHLPVEMDVLRALERDADVETAYALLRRLGAGRESLDEGRVVYASYLLDRGRAEEAWELTRPGSLGANPPESTLRVWYVAARAALRVGERATARRIYHALQETDPGFPGLDELDAALRDSGGGQEPASRR